MSEVFFCAVHGAADALVIVVVPKVLPVGNGGESRNHGKHGAVGGTLFRAPYANALLIHTE